MKINISISKDIILDAEDLVDIKKDPKGWADSLYDADLISLIKTANKQYHNDGTSQVTDKQFDILIDELRTRKPNHPLLKQAGAVPVAKGRKKVKLPYSLFSLDKVKPGSGVLDKWVASHKGPYIVSDKEDGLSIELIYDGGVPTAAYTRGNGIVGQDVTHLIPHFGVPAKIPYRKHLAVRMETAMTEETFNAHFSKEASTTTGKKYENARNLVAGIVNTVNRKHAAIDHIQTWAYEIIEPRMKPSEALITLKKYKFQVVPYVLAPTLTEEFLTNYLIKRKKLSPIAMDGLVIEQDKKTTRPTAGNPDYQIAWKVQEEDDTALAEVVKVIWQTSKHGKLKPVLLLKIPGQDTLKRLKL